MGWVLPCIPKRTRKRQSTGPLSYRGSVWLLYLSRVCVCGTICWLARGQSWQFKPTYTDAQKALFMAVCVGFEPTERSSRSRFSKPAHLPLCQHTSWQELKDLNPYKMIWNHLCYRYTKSLENGGKDRIRTYDTQINNLPFWPTELLSLFKIVIIKNLVWIIGINLWHTMNKIICYFNIFFRIIKHILPFYS